MLSIVGNCSAGLDMENTIHRSPEHKDSVYTVVVFLFFPMGALLHYAKENRHI